MTNALIMRSQDEADINDLDSQQVMSDLAKYGAVLFRNYDLSLDIFSTWIKRFCSHITFDPARAKDVGETQKVDAGFDGLGLHIENGTSPLPPELLFFYCEKAAKEGSETTICDGQVLWDALSENAQLYFSENLIKVRRILPEQVWQLYLSNEYQDIEEPASATREHFARLVDDDPKSHHHFLENNAVDCSLFISGVRQGPFNEAPAFANSLLGPSFNYATPDFTDEFDEPIPEDLMREIREVSDMHTQDIQWQDGDMIMIDNHRIMHGRRAIKDPERKLFIGLGNRNIRINNRR